MNLRQLNLGKSLRSRTVKLYLPINATNLQERCCRCDMLIAMDAKNTGAEGQHEVAVKHICLVEETDC